MSDTALLIRDLRHADYLPTWQAMQTFTNARTPDTQDEIWLIEHPPVYTMGQNGQPEHLLMNPQQIPVVKTDRGGQITYHGPGQLLIYVLMNLSRQNFGVRALVCALEKTIIAFLASFNIAAEARRDAPGVYVEGAKIAAVGLRIRHGYSYHGLSFNINMDLSPFQNINPCGYKDLKVTDLQQLKVLMSLPQVISQLLPYLMEHLRYTSYLIKTEPNSN